MPKLKTAAEVAEKWARVAPTRQTDYEAGVRDPGADWAKAAAAGSESYASGVQEAIGRNAFARGIESAGNDTWRRKTVEAGIPRWAQGVRVAQRDMEEGFARPREVIERTLATLPPRGPRGDPRNQERAALMARNLAEARKRG